MDMNLAVIKKYGLSELIHDLLSFYFHIGPGWFGQLSPEININYFKCLYNLVKHWLMYNIGWLSQ